MKNHYLKNRSQVNFCNVNLFKFPNRKNKKKENKSPSFFTYSNISNEKETKTETTIFDEKDKTIQKLNVKIGELENRIKNLEMIIITNTQTITINKNYEANNIKQLITEPSSIKKKIFFSQKQSPKKVISKFPKNKTFDDKRLLRNSHDLIKSLKSFTRNKLGRNISLSKLISRTNSIENIIHNYSYKNKENSYFRSFTKTNHKNNNINKSVNNSNIFSNLNDLIPKIPKKSLLNEQKIVKTRNFKNELLNIKNRTKDLLESFSKKKN